MIKCRIFLTFTFCYCCWLKQKSLWWYINSIFPFFFLKGGETIFIIFTHKVDDQSGPEVEFSVENVVSKRVPGTVENEYTISVAAPGKYLHETYFYGLDGVIFKTYIWNHCISFFFSPSRYACRSRVAHRVHWPIQCQLKACYVLYQYGRSKSVSWKRYGSC